uniref:Uncharacterized protein n=1 Tax=Cajanus cajan TaxID=3821 RepID=A0A151U902_CAJCA|nr:hypothetical protein KK1_020010 [Cajanus cajan]
MEGPSGMIRKAENKGNLHDICIYHNAPCIHHLMFVANCFLVFGASECEASEVVIILKVFKGASGETINLEKLEVFFNRNLLLNLAMPGKQAWRLLSNLHSLVTCLCNERYYPNNNFNLCHLSYK